MLATHDCVVDMTYNDYRVTTSVGGSSNSVLRKLAEVRDQIRSWVWIEVKMDGWSAYCRIAQDQTAMRRALTLH